MKLYALLFVSAFAVIGCSSGNDASGLNDNTALVDGMPELDQCVCGESDQVVGASNGCLEVVNHERIRFCYQEFTRILSAYEPDETLWWSFELPGSNEQNKIEHLLVTSEYLFLVANVDPLDTEKSVFEISSFEFGGAFVATSRELTPIDQIFGPIQAVAAHKYTYLIADCFDADGQGTYVSRHRIPHNDEFNSWGSAYIDSAVTDSVCLSGMARDGSPSFEQPDKIVLSANGEEIKLDLYTLKPAITFDTQGYSLERRVEIRDQLLAVLTDPERAYPDIAHRVVDRIRIISPDDNQPFNLDCVDGGARAWSNWNGPNGSLGSGGSFDYSNCRTGSLFVESGRSMSESFGSTGGFLGNNSVANIVARYAVSDSASNEEWQVATYTNSTSTGSGKSRESALKFSIEFVSYNSPSSNLSVAPSRYTKSDTQQHWIGSFSRENYTSAITENVNVDITLNTDDAGNIQMSGSLSAMLVGETTQTFKIEMLPNTNELIKYTITSNDESMSVIESW